MKPIIGIVPESITLKHRWDGHGSFCGSSYSHAIELAGGRPLVLPLTCNHDLLNQFLDMCGGLLLIGGGDVNPARYGARLCPAEKNKLWGVDDQRDEMEIYLCRRAVERDWPVLGVCRGIQLLNVAYGGTLLPHITGHSVRQTDALAHRLEWASPQQLPVCRWVNTSHHQAVDRVAPGFNVVARAPDGIIEAIEKPDARFCCAVQFHPERLLKKSSACRQLFIALVKASGRDSRGSWRTSRRALAGSRRAR